MKIHFKNALVFGLMTPALAGVVPRQDTSSSSSSGTSDPFAGLEQIGQELFQLFIKEAPVVINDFISAFQSFASAASSASSSSSKRSELAIDAPEIVPREEQGSFELITRQSTSSASGAASFFTGLAPELLQDFIKYFPEIIAPFAQAFSSGLPSSAANGSANGVSIFETLTQDFANVVQEAFKDFTSASSTTSSSSRRDLVARQSSGLGSGLASAASSFFSGIGPMLISDFITYLPEIFSFFIKGASLLGSFAGA